MADEREELLKKQFAGQRSQLKGQRREVERQSGKSLNRLQALVGTTGGAIEKAKQNQIRDIGQGFAEVESGVKAQEAGALQALKGEREERSFQREEAEKSRGLAREQLDFQRNSFAEQMQFQWAEFDENQRTNLLNSAIAIRESGLDSAKAWDNLINRSAAFSSIANVRQLN